MAFTDLVTRKPFTVLDPETATLADCVSIISRSGKFPPLRREPVDEAGNINIIFDTIGLASNSLEGEMPQVRQQQAAMQLLCAKGEEAMRAPSNRNDIAVFPSVKALASAINDITLGRTQGSAVTAV
jgi:hypothetical protein